MNAQASNRPASSVRSLVFLLVFLVILIILQPFLWGWVKKSTLVLHEKRTLTEQIKETEIRIRDTRNKYKTQSVYIDQLESVIPGSQNALQVIERLETATQGLDIQVEVSRIDEGIALKSVTNTISAKTREGVASSTESPTITTQQTTSKIFPLHITLLVTGPPEALVEYIDSVEHVQELSMIQKFTLSPVIAKPGQTIELNPNYFQLLMTAVFYLQNNDDDTTE